MGLLALHWVCQVNRGAGCESSQLNRGCRPVSELAEGGFGGGLLLEVFSCLASTLVSVSGGIRSHRVAV